MVKNRIKICGITRLEDAIFCARIGVDAIGLVFYQKSKRYVTPVLAREICLALPPFVTCVGLFLNSSRREISQVLETVPLDLLQFHGDESEADCNQFSRPYIKALRVREGMDLLAAETLYPSARGILLDTYVSQEPGGTGQTFNWSIVPDKMKKPIILAGGLNAENVCDAIASVSPYAVDVSGGVESSISGVKDAKKINNFVGAVQGCCAKQKN